MFREIWGTDFLGSVPWAQVQSSSGTHCNVNVTKVVNRNTSGHHKCPLLAPQIM